jgi:hypothetical protein
VHIVSIGDGYASLDVAHQIVDKLKNAAVLVS